MADHKIRSLFAQDIERRIEEVIKVDQTDEGVVRDEIREYVVTDAIQRSFNILLDRYLETPNKPHEGIGVWVSGFFGSGKSSFAKYLGMGIENRPLQEAAAASLLRERFRDNKASVLLQTINEKIPTHVVIFDVSSERGIRAGQSLTEITYLALLRSLGYAQNLDLAELEIALEAEGRLDAFKGAFGQLYPGQHWDTKKNLPVMAMNQASAALNRLDFVTYPNPDSWVKGARTQADINPRRLAERCKALIERRLPGKALMFVVDEVGQFVARDVQKMLDLQALVQQLGVAGRGKFWLVVTSQEKLTELVSGLDDRRVELARVMDRFPQELQVHLEPSDISEVTSRRVLEKNKDAEVILHKIYEEHRARLADCTRVTAEIKLPELSALRFVALYPLLPYQVELIINVVSGLRTQGGASKHVGGANRTIIKLAQQLLVNPQVDLAHKEIGQLVTLEHVYDLVSGNIEGEVRGKITDIPKLVSHPMAQAVAKTVCMLQFVKTVHRTAENIAAMLHPTVASDSKLPLVREALAELEKAMLVRKGDDGYRIPSPVEDDWERSRSALEPKTSERNQILAETLTGFWDPQPSQTLNGVKLFKAGLLVNGKELLEGDLPVSVHLTGEGQDYRDQVEELRRRSQAEKFTIFWAASLAPALDEEVVQFFRSKEILRLRERDARTPDQGHLVVEERHRLSRHREEIRRRLRDALLSGSVFFRGNDRSPEGGTGVDTTVKNLLGQALPEVYHRFGEAASKLEAKDLSSLLTADTRGQLGELSDSAFGRAVGRHPENDQGVPEHRQDLVPPQVVELQLDIESAQGGLVQRPHQVGRRDEDSLEGFHLGQHLVHLGDLPASFSTPSVLKEAVGLVQQQHCSISSSFPEHPSHILLGFPQPLGLKIRGPFHQQGPVKDFGQVVAKGGLSCPGRPIEAKPARSGTLQPGADRPEVPVCVENLQAVGRRWRSADPRDAGRANCCQGVAQHPVDDLIGHEVWLDLQDHPGDLGGPLDPSRAQVLQVGGIGLPLGSDRKHGQVVVQHLRPHAPRRDSHLHGIVEPPPIRRVKHTAGIGDPEGGNRVFFEHPVHPTLVPAAVREARCLLRLFGAAEHIFDLVEEDEWPGFTAQDALGQLERPKARLSLVDVPVPVLSRNLIKGRSQTRSQDLGQLRLSCAGRSPEQHVRPLAVRIQGPTEQPLKDLQVLIQVRVVIHGKGRGV